MQMLLDFGTKIIVHDPNSASDKEVESKSSVDSLLKSVGTLEVYKAVASEAYLAMGFPDPVEKAFELSDVLTKLSRVSIIYGWCPKKRMSWI